MKKLFIIVCLSIATAFAAAEDTGNVVLLGDKGNIAFDPVKAIYLASTVNALLQSCTTAVRVDSIPPVGYKGVRVTRADGSVIEAHIFPNSKSSYRVEVYSKKNGVTQAHGKYTDHAYQLISMLELRK
jgi:competence transcription factor ComK